MDLLADLNEAQRQAVTHVDGPLLVLAGAGSGKTRVITRRVAHLISRGIPPAAILAITFTNKAAGEMKQRVQALGVPAAATIGTFHAVCARLLREFAAPAGLPRSFSIYDQDDQLRCVKQALGRRKLSTTHFPPAAVLSAISRAKNSLQEPAAYAQQADSYFAKTAAAVYPLYQRILAENAALDFDDLLMRVALLMRDHPEVRLLLAQRFRYILIDEYQDTNHAQYVIAHGIALEHENICATGDPDQSIYGWRGADLNNILDFEADYPDAVVIRLEQNYRSFQPILSAASSLIRHNRRRKHKELLATRAGGQQVEVIRLQDEHAEADEVAAIVAGLSQRGLAYRDVAVFYRINALSRVLEEAFRKAGIAYQIARGVEFHNRKEIKDVLAYLRLLANPADDLCCRRIINVPARGLGAVTVNRLAASAQARGVSLLEACRDPAAAGLGQAPAAKVKAFSELMAALAAQPDRPVRPLIETAITRTGIEAALRQDPDQREPLRNVQELVSAAEEFDRLNPGAALADYLHQVSLVSDIDSVNPQAGAVTFMTLHAAKGLEFPAVFVIGCEQGLLPFERGGSDEHRDEEEERRLAFVGMTRAKDRLYLTSAKHRLLRGQTTRQSQSAFLFEIGQQDVKRTDKTEFEPPPRRKRVSVEKFQEDVQTRQLIEAMEASRLIPEQFSGLRPGRRVKHPMFGPGTIQSISCDGTRTRAVILFDRTGRKTIILEKARLEPI